MAEEIKGNSDWMIMVCLVNLFTWGEEGMPLLLWTPDWDIRAKNKLKENKQTNSSL